MPLKRQVTRKPKPWNAFDVELGDPDHEKWGKSPEIDECEADGLTGCCCLCCHRNTCRSISECFLGAFPHHITANQFFTPDMFSAYHREGYAACVEADIAEFFRNRVTV